MESAYKNSDYVFIGRAVESKLNLETGIVRVKFSVVKNYRGAVNAYQSVYAESSSEFPNKNGVVRISSCEGYSFSAGHSYLIFSGKLKSGYKGVEEGQPYIGYCSLTRGVKYPPQENSTDALLYYLEARDSGLDINIISVRELRKLVKTKEVKTSDLFIISE